MFLSAHWSEVNLWVHILSACVWIGGQVLLAALLPILRGQPALTAAAGRRYAQIAWTAYALLLVTGVINVHDAGITWTNLTGTPAGRTLLVKLGFVALSGLAAAAHSLIVAPRVAAHRTRPLLIWSAMLGVASLLAAALAALYGVIIAEA